MVGVQVAPTQEPAYTPALYVDRVSYEAASEERVSFGVPTPNSVAQCKFLESLIGKDDDIFHAYSVPLAFRMCYR